MKKLTGIEFVLKVDELAETGLGGLLGSSLNLEVVVVDTGDVSVGKSRDLSSWSTNTASDIKDLHSRLDAHLRGEEVFVSSELGISAYF
jgi:hypothetical protein